MGKLRGFMEYERRDPGYRPREERIRDFRAVELRLTEEETRLQAARCMDCGIPYCHSGALVDQHSLRDQEHPGQVYVQGLLPRFQRVIFKGIAVLALVLLVGAGHLAWQARLANGAYAADPRNPYVYAQTSPDLLNLVRRVEALAQVHPQGRQMLVKVMAADGDYWPLPWYLRNLKQVGCWDRVPTDPYAPVMIVSAQMHAGLDEKKTHVMVGYFQLRPQVFFELYVDLKLWQAYLAKNPPKPD